MVELEVEAAPRRRAELFVAVLGMPWSSPPLAGHGLARFDRASGRFAAATDRRLNARSVAQQPRGEGLMAARGRRVEQAVVRLTKHQLCNRHPARMTDARNTLG